VVNEAPDPRSQEAHDRARASHATYMWRGDTGQLRPPSSPITGRDREAVRVEETNYETYTRDGPEQRGSSREYRSRGGTNQAPSLQDYEPYPEPGVGRERVRAQSGRTYRSRGTGGGKDFAHLNVIREDKW
jgi:hypothetical protein